MLLRYPVESRAPSWVSIPPRLPLQSSNLRNKPDVGNWRETSLLQTEMVVGTALP